MNIKRKVDKLVKLLKKQYPNSDFSVKYYSETDEYYIQYDNKELRDNEDFNYFVYEFKEKKLWKKGIYNISITFDFSKVNY